MTRNGIIIQKYTYNSSGIGDFIKSSYEWYCYCYIHKIDYYIDFNCEADVKHLSQTTSLFLVNGEYKRHPIHKYFKNKYGLINTLNDLMHKREFRYYVNFINDGSKFVKTLDLLLANKVPFYYIIYTNVHGSDIAEKIDLKVDYLNFLQKSPILIKRINELTITAIKKLCTNSGSVSSLSGEKRVIHLRLGDANTFRKDLGSDTGSDKRMSMEKAIMFAEKYNDCFIFTDSEELKKKYPQRTLDSVVPRHSSFYSDDDLLDTFAEFFVIGRFDTVLCPKSAVSMFSGVSAYIHGRKLVFVDDVSVATK
jgi:hypothetical protein